MGSGSKKKKNKKKNVEIDEDGVEWEYEECRWVRAAEQFNAIHSELEKTDSDRASVLVVSAMVDNGMEMVLRQRFKQLSEATDDECDFLLTKRPQPPIGSASIRAKVVFCVGVIDRKLLDSCCSIFEIRNKFAHQAITPSLTADIADGLLGKLPKMLQEWAGWIEPQLPYAGTPRNRFMACCLAIYAVLFEMAETIDDPEPRLAGPPIFGFGDAGSKNEDS